MRRRVAIRLLAETLAKLPDTLDDPALVKALLCAVGSSDAEVRHQGVTEACTIAADARLPRLAAMCRSKGWDAAAIEASRSPPKPAARAGPSAQAEADAQKKASTCVCVVC